LNEIFFSPHGPYFSLAFSTASLADDIKVAVTTSFHNSGLSDILLPEIKKDLGLDVHLLVVGTGQALKLGRAGDVDAILVHSRNAEDTFVAEGYGTHRREIMYNDLSLSAPAAIRPAFRLPKRPMRRWPNCRRRGHICQPRG